MSGYSLVLPGGTRTAIGGELTLGRAAGNQLRLADPAVSRRHLRLVATEHGVEVHDLDSRSGTFLNGRRVAGAALACHGQRLRVGDTRLRIERERRPDEASDTIVVPAGYTLSVDAYGHAEGGAAPGGPPLPLRPRLRSGHRRKLLAAGAGARRFVIENTRTRRFLSFTKAEWDLLEWLDRDLAVPELVRSVAQAHGEGGVRRLMEMLAELADAGLLAGAPAAEESGPAGWRRHLRPRERVFAHGPGIVAAIYRRGGRRLFTRPALGLIAATIPIGAAAFAAVALRGDVRPLHVDGRVALGGLTFIGGRFAVVALHELAHALTLLSFGRRPRRIGAKLIVVFPYAFVDTSDMWYESSPRRRIAVSAAGPVNDALLGGLFALTALATAGAARDVAFQLALGAYLGTLVNLNPLLERDGYHVLADLLREPNLRRRGRAYVAGRLAGRPAGEADSPAVRRYGVAALGWAVMTPGCAGVVALRFAGRETGDPRLVIGAGALALLAALAPTALLIARPLRSRRGGSAQATHRAKAGR